MTTTDAITAAREAINHYENAGTITSATATMLRSGLTTDPIGTIKELRKIRASIGCRAPRVGNREVAEMAGVSHQRVHQLDKEAEARGYPKGGFPRPTDKLKAGRIWRRQDIEDWMMDTARDNPPYQTKGT